jgi:hypothetical protein
MTEIDLQIILLGLVLLIAFALMGLRVRQRGAALHHWFEADSQRD